MLCARLCVGPWNPEQTVTRPPKAVCASRGEGTEARISSAPTAQAVTAQLTQVGPGEEVGGTRIRQLWLVSLTGTGWNQRCTHKSDSEQEVN